jgi:PKD repeat protein
LSYDPDGYIVSYEWEFGDGTQVTTNNPIVDHTYTASGSYTVNLTVIDNDGLSDRTSKVITVKQSHPALISCDASGSPKDYFAPGESVYVKGNNLEPNTAYKIWIQPEPVSDGNPLNPEDDPSGEQEIVITDENGNFGTIVIWCVPADAEPTYEHWDIVADKQDDGANTGVYNSDSDAIDSATTFGIVAPIPELSTLALVCLGLFGILVGRRIL